MRAGIAVIDEFVTHRLPRETAVIGPLDQLPGPAARLRSVQPVRIHRRTLHMVDFPTSEMRPGNLPLIALSIRTQEERAFPGANQNSYFAHGSLLNRHRGFTIHHPGYAEPIG